ncbi:MAG TPA: type II toxin-antitoxin system VapC family toxin [Polyangiales bacterium]
MKLLPALSDPAHDLYVSAASIWEMAIKIRLGKLKLHVDLAEFVATQTGPGVAEVLAITATHALGVALVPQHHRDPFDHMIVAQAKAEQMTVVSADRALRAYDVPILWD